MIGAPSRAETVPHPPTPEQRRAIEARDRDVFCEAGAGSGKTRVLVERYCAAIVDDGVGIERILAFTFTERAAAELRGRIRRALVDRGKEAAAAGEGDRAHELTTLARASERAWVTTIHGFCRRVLASRPAAAGLDPRFRVLDEAEAIRLRESAVAESIAELAAGDPDTFGRALAAYRPRRFADMVLAAHSRLRSQGMLAPRLPRLGEPVRSARGGDEDAPDGLTPAELEAAGQARAALEAALEAFGRRYEEAKAARSALDFADLELRALELLRTTTAGAEWRRRFDHLLVDEFQDTNIVQVDLVEALRGPDTRVFVVGDENQSIYRFRNAELEVFRAERARAREGRTAMVDLRGNFRSNREVLGAVNALGGSLLDGFEPLATGRVPSAAPPPTELLLTLEDGGEATWSAEEIELEPPPSETRPAVVAEARNLAERLRDLVAAGAVERGRIVVLLRAFTHVDAYEEALRRCGLRPYVVGGRGYWSQQQVEDVIRLLATISNPLDDEFLLGALASPACGVSPDALWLLRRGAGEGRHLWPTVEWAFGASEREPVGIARGPLEAIGDDDRERLRSFCSTLAALRMEAPVLGLEELTDRAITAFGYDLALLARPGGAGRMANVRKLMRLAREFERHEGRDLAGFLAAAAESTRRDEREGMAALAAEDHDGVRVMTVHAAKGLEFEVVAVPDLGRGLAAGHRWGDVVIGSGEGRDRFGMRLAFPSAKSFGLWELVALNQEEQRAEAAESCRLVHVAATRATDRLILSGIYRPRHLEPLDEPRPSDTPLRRFLPSLAARGWDGGDADLTLPAPTAVPGTPADDAASAAGDGSVPLVVRVNRPSAERAGLLVRRFPEPAPDDDDAATRPPPLIERRRRSVPVGHLSYSALSSYERCGYRFYAERVLGLVAVPGWGASEDGEGDDETLGEPPDEIAEPPAGGDPGARERSLAFGRAVHRALEWSARSGWRTPPERLLHGLLAVGGGDGELASRAASMVAGWLESPIRAEIGSSAVRAEVPFALPLGGTIVRGKIDLLGEIERRRTVIDFKTDELRGRPAAALADRYRVQRELYALAAAGPADGASVRAIHVFLEDPTAPIVDELGPLELAAARDRVEALIGRIRGGEFAPPPAPEAAVCFGCPAAANLCPNAAWRPPG